MFKKALFTLMIVSAFAVLPLKADAAERATKEEAKSMTEKAVAMFKEKGKDATFTVVNDSANPELHDRELYVFVYDATGTCVAHGAKASLIGKNLIKLKDSDGKLMIKEIVSVPDTGWVDFRWQNPTTKKVEPKSAYIIHEGDYWFGVGIYKQN